MVVQLRRRSQCSACELIRDIFKAGVWVGVVFVVLIVGIVGFIASKLRA